MLKRLLAILFLVLFLFTSTEIEQLLKLPKLMEHFSEHRLNSKHLSFLEFLNLHYLNNEAHGHASDKDHHLPFKSIDDCHCLSFLALPMAMVEYIQVFSFLNQDILTTYQEDFISSSFLSSIWQPPKFS